MSSIKSERNKSIDSKLTQIGKKARLVRKHKFSNYEHFAKLNNLNKVTVSNLESGQNVTLKTLIEVLDILDISLEDFFKDLK